MKYTSMFLFILTYCALPLFAWDPDPKLSLEGILKTAQRERITKHPDGKEEKWIERHNVLVPDEPIILSRTISIGDRKSVVQQKSIPFIRVCLKEEFESLKGKRVQLQGYLTKPFDFFLLDDIEFDVITALDVIWEQKHQTRTVKYEPDITELRGTIYQKIYPGPPNYENIEKGDRLETAFILALNEPINVEVESLEEDDLNQTERGVREIHISFTDSEPPKECWDREISVKGTLYSAHTGHHRRRVLMSANHWESAK